MATRKENIDIEYDEPQQKAVSGAAESNDPYESQDPADWVPPMAVRIYPISKPRTKLLSTANVNIAKSFAVQGFRISDTDIKRGHKTRSLSRAKERLALRPAT